MTYLTDEDWMKFQPLLCCKAKQNFLEYFFNTVTQFCLSLDKSCQILISISMIYFHKFYIVNGLKLEKGLPRLCIPAACVILAVKKTNLLRTLDKLFEEILKKYKNDCPDARVTKVDDQRLLETIKRLTFGYELEILQKLNFDLEIDFPYEFNAKFKKYLLTKDISEENSEKILSTSRFYYNDSFVFPLCLYYCPDIIVISTILFMNQKFKFKLNEGEIISLSRFKIKAEDIHTCKRIISMLYERKPQDDTISRQQTQS